MNTLCRCGIEMAKINGRTLKMLVQGRNHRFGRINPKKWIEICPSCDAKTLKTSDDMTTPFLCADGVMRVATDFDQSTGQYVGSELTFACLRFSQSALRNAMYVFQKQEGFTRDVEAVGASISEFSSPSELLAFSEIVCKWGRGQRVWGNLLRLNKSTALAKKYAAWFASARTAKDDEHAIQPGSVIPGLGISFASKHLRMLDPGRYAVLDAVLSDGLGFALNPKGYKLFMTLLREFAEADCLGGNVAAVEGGLFVLVRQQVRAQ